MIENNFISEMKRWPVCLLLLGIGATLIAADTSNGEDDDDGIVIEEEKIVSSIAIPCCQTI